MRVHVKKKHYKDHVRSQTLAGFVNSPEGNWTSPGNLSPSVVKNVIEGTRGKTVRRRGGAKVNKELE